MPTRDTGGQQHRTSQRSSEAEDAPQARTSDSVKERKDRLDEDVDSLLEEIDDVLEENAEDFVKSFVQKGGQ